MMKSNRVLLAVAAVTLAMGLTGCGKDKYDGTYTGFEVRSVTTQGAQPTPTVGTGMSSARAVTVTLANNGDAVTGTYQVTMSNGVGSMGYNGYNSYSPYSPYAMGNMSGAGESYQLTASSAQSGSLTNVMLVSTGGYSMYSNCLMQGSLTSENHGQTLSGTLSSPSSAASNCGTIQLTLTRGN